MDIDAAVDAHERASSRFADLVRSLPPEPQAVLGSEWSTVEVGAHVLSVFRGYTRAAAGIAPVWPSLDGVAGNQRLLDATPERSPGELADALDVAGREMRAALRDSDAPITVFGDLAASAAAILGISAADVLVHGLDLARTIRAAWAIDQHDAVLGFVSLAEILPAFVKPESTGFSATYGLHLRRTSDWSLAFDRGTLRIEPGRPERADCRISATPRGWMLAGYGRISPARALLTGQVVAYGRKPWLAPRFAQQFNPP
jgi:Mycothiol maleylpyruvate isomerase N-terminal domain/SCP-2 sterol transfer family